MRKGTAFLTSLALVFFLFFSTIATHAQISTRPQGLTEEDLRKWSRSRRAETSTSDSTRPAYPDKPASGAGGLFSSSVSKNFYEIAYELTNSKDTGGQHTEQAIVFLNAAIMLDNNFKDAYPLLIKLAYQVPQKDYSNLIYNLLTNYVNESADVEIVTKAIKYLLQQLNTREQREKFLEQTLKTIGGKNNVIDSELSTLLGMLKAEKADLETAEFYLTQAYQKNRYNKLAFVKLAEFKPQQIGPALYLERLRLALRENPSDIDAALEFAQQAEQFQLYETSAAAYEYCASLFNYLYPSETLPARIYLPWAISNYNTQQGQVKCLQIAQRIQEEGKFDLLLEAIAGKAALKIGKGQVATQIFQTAEKKAQAIISQTSQQNPSSSQNLNSNQQQINAQQLAWFYCFALPLPEKALAWANHAASTEPNSPSTNAILAYALVMNNQLEWAQPLINNSGHNQIAGLALAHIQLAEGQQSQAIETLKTAISQDPGSFAAENAKEILAQLGENYTPPVDTDSVLATLMNVFGQDIAPAFIPPEQIILAQLNIPGNEFPYGSEFNGTVIIKNNSPEPIVISDNALLKGNIRIDVQISGDINKKISNLVSAKFRSTLIINPGRSANVPVPLITGELKETLFNHPQASLNIEFTLYLDPVTNEYSKLTNRLTHIEPTKVRIKRPGLELTAKYLRNQLNLLSKNYMGQKIKAAQLFTGLLKEQYAISNRTSSYRYMSADWMKPLLRSALLHESGLLHNPANGQWVVKVHTMVQMLSLPMDLELAAAVAKNLRDNNWPVRLTAVYLLANTTDSSFYKVLDWTAKKDPNKLVRDMAIALSNSISP